MFSESSRLHAAGIPSSEGFDSNPPRAAGNAGEVLLHNGEVLHTASDLTFPSRQGLGFTFNRTYRSHLAYSGPLGKSWDHNHNQRLVLNGVTPEKATCAEWHTGSRTIKFTKTANVWKPESGAFYKLAFKDKNGFIETPQLLRYTFGPSQGDDSRLRIETISTRHGGHSNTVQRYVYGAGSDRLDEVIDPYGNHIRFVHDETGLLKEISSGDVRVVFTHAGDNNLVAVTQSTVMLSLSGKATDLTTRYAYQDKFGIAWLLDRTKNGGEVTVKYQYDLEQTHESFGRVTKTFASPTQQLEPESPCYTFSYAFLRYENLHRVGVQPPRPQPSEEFSFTNQNQNANQPEPLPQKHQIPSQNATWTYSYNDNGQTGV